MMEYFICETIHALLKKETCINIRKGKSIKDYGLSNGEVSNRDRCKNCSKIEQFHKNEYSFDEILQNMHREYLLKIAPEYKIIPKTHVSDTTIIHFDESI